MAKEEYNDKQLIALTTMDKNVIVSAGAGSGKTKVLSNRFLEILKTYNKYGINADNILAITFTRKAANEMKERVRKNMLKRMAKDLDQLEIVNDEELRIGYQEDYDLWNVQLKKLEMAQVCTIDSLCSSILRENILEAGIAPGSEMIEDHENHEFYDECVGRFINNTLDGKLNDSHGFLNEDLRILVKEYNLYGFKKQLKKLMTSPKIVLDFQRDSGDSDDEVIEKLKERYDYSSEVFADFADAIQKLAMTLVAFDSEYKRLLESKRAYEDLTVEIEKLNAEKDKHNVLYQIALAKCKELEETKKEISKTGDKEAKKDISSKLKVAKEEKSRLYEPVKILTSQIKDLEKQLCSKTDLKKICDIIDIYEKLTSAIPSIMEDLKKTKPTLKEFKDCVLDINVSQDSVLKQAIEIAKNEYLNVEPYFYNDRAKELVPCWYRVLSAFNQYFIMRKNEENILTFEDIENKALELLSQNVDVRRKYQKRFMFIMVDEFQDTNDLQKKLVYLLYGDCTDCLAKPNATLELEKEFALKNLFVVGDPKQSIYRFRGADVSVFHQVEKDMTELDASNPNKGILVSMNTNYRSDKKILDACNQFFPNVMGTDLNEAVFYEDLEWGGFTNSGTDVELLNVSVEDKSEKRESEAKVLAEKIISLHNEGQKYSDITILMKVMTNCDALTNQFQQMGIPYVVSSGQGFYQQDEVADILHLLKAITKRTCITELVGILCSPFFKFNEQLLTELALEGCLGSFYKMKQHNNEKVKHAGALLDLLSHKAQVLDPIAFWNALWKDLEIEKVLLKMRNGRVKLANVEKLRDDALNYYENGSGSLEKWLDRTIAMQADEEVKEKCAVVAANDAVNIMTIHGSKGLQFPIVIVPMLDYNRNDKGGEIEFNSEAGLGIKVKGEDDSLAKTSVYFEANKSDDELEDEERIRLLYVAMTRAEHKLILSGTLIDHKTDTDEEAKPKKEVSGIKNIRALTWLEQFGQSVKDKTEEDSSNYVIVVAKTIDSVVNSSTKPQNSSDTSDARNVDQAKQEKSDISADKDLELIQPLSSFGKIGSITFTPTSLQTYSSCPLKYYYQYVLGIPGLNNETEVVKIVKLKSEEDETEKEEVIPVHEYRGELDAPRFGNLLHRTLELYSNGLCTLEQAFEQAKQDNEIDTENCGKAWELLEKYTQSELYLQQIKGAAKLLNEQKFTAYLFGKHRMVGVFDCLAFDKDGNMHIIDYKTGPYHKNNDGYGIQLALYREVANKLFGQNGQHKVVDAKLHYIPDGKEWDLDQDGTGKYLEMAQEIFDKIVVSSTEDDFIDDEFHLCSNCNYSFMCKKRFTRK